jgi:hypothetical protein
MNIKRIKVQSQPRQNLKISTFNISTKKLGMVGYNPSYARGIGKRIMV